MTLYHFGNCVALALVPVYLVYKYSGLSDYGAFWKCFQAGGIYVFTQLCKMLVLTFFPETSSDTSGIGFNFIAECLRSSADLLDFVGLAFVLSKIPGKGHSKLLTAGVGWTAAEVILSRGLTLWAARGAEFSWIYTQKSLESNVLLITHVSTATLLWLWTRHDLNKKLVPVVTFILLCIAFRGVWLEGILFVLGTGPWVNLALKGLASSIFGLATLHIYSGLAQSIGI